MKTAFIAAILKTPKILSIIRKSILIFCVPIFANFLHANTTFVWVNDDPSSQFEGTLVLNNLLSNTFGAAGLPGRIGSDLTWTIQVPFLADTLSPQIFTESGHSLFWSMEGQLDSQGNLSSYSLSGGAAGLYGWNLNSDLDQITFRTYGPYLDQGQSGPDVQFYDMTLTTTGHWNSVPDTGATLGLLIFAMLGVAAVNRKWHVLR